MAASQTNWVLVPGLLCTEELFAPQVSALGVDAHVTIGDTTRSSSFGEMARGILAKAPATFVLAGLSMGGYIAFEVLRQAPERVTGLALLDTNARADRPEQAEQRRSLVALARAQGIAKAADQLWPFLVHKDRQADAELLGITHRMAEDIGVETFARQQEAIIARPDNRPFLKEIRCPTLIIVGAEDALTPVKVAEEMHAGIAGSRLEIIPDCGHLSTLERPAAVAAILGHWASSL